MSQMLCVGRIIVENFIVGTFGLLNEFQLCIFDEANEVDLNGVKYYCFN